MVGGIGTNRALGRNRVLPIVADEVKPNSVTRAALAADVAAALPDGPFAPAVDARLAAAPSVVSAAASAASSAVGAEVTSRKLVGTRQEIVPEALSWAILYEGSREVAFAQYRDGTTYPPISVDGLGLVAGYRGWRIAAVYADGEVHWGIRDDGSQYPPSSAVSTGGGVSVDPLTTAPVLMLGHSIIENWYDSTTDLATKLGRAVSIRAIGGTRSDQIAAMYGAIPAGVTVSGNALPASGAVSCTVSVGLLNSSFDTSRSLAGQLGGVSVLLRCTTASGVHTYTVEQTAPGVAIPVSPGTPFVPTRPAALVVGGLMRNDLSAIAASTMTLDQSIANQRAILGLAPWPEHALILGVLPSATEVIGSRATYDAAAAAQKAAFGRQWVDWLGWLQSPQAATAGGITFTGDDATDIANGIVPRSFRSDSLHLNNAGELATNRLIQLHYQARGLINA